MKRFMFFIGGLALIAVFSGCAALFGTPIAQVPANSTPEGEQVFVNGQYMGVTPMTLQLKKNDNYTIEFRKEGYQPQVKVINSRVGAGWIVLDVLGGLIPVIVDAATGSWMELYQKL